MEKTDLLKFAHELQDFQLMAVHELPLKLGCRYMNFWCFAQFLKHLRATLLVNMLIGNAFAFVLLRSIVNGLDPQEAAARIRQFGPNVVDPPREWPLWAKFAFAFFSGFAPLLWVATFLVFLSWEPFGTPPSNLYNLILAIVLIYVITTSSIFTFYQVTTNALSIYLNSTPIFMVHLSFAFVTYTFRKCKRPLC